MRRARLLVLVPMIVGVLGATTAPALAERPAFVFPAGCCFYDGGTVRTVVPPAAFPNEGNDAFYVVMGAGQRLPLPDPALRPSPRAGKLV